MKRISRIVSVILIVCMCSCCVYAEDSTTITNNEDNKSFNEQVEYIKDFKFDKSEATEKEDKVDLYFSWTVDREFDKLKGVTASLYKDSTYSLDSKVKDVKLNADTTEICFEDVDKNSTYYAEVIPCYEGEDGSEQFGKALNCIGVSKPEITNIKANGTVVTVTYNTVKDAVKYAISYENNGKEVTVNTTATTYSISGLKQNASYNFRVRALFEDDESGLTSTSEWSDVKNVVTGAMVLATPALKIVAYNKGAILTWNKVSGATSYEVWRCYGGKWSKIKTLSATTYKNTGLKVNKKYIYKVKALRSTEEGNVYSKFSNSKSITAKTYLTGDIKHGYGSGVLIRGAKKYKAGSSTKLASKSLLKKGTKVTIIDRCKVGRHNMSYVKTSKGKKYWIRSGNIKFNAPYTTKDYTTEDKENFVNKKGYSSKTKYLLFISCYTQKVYVFKGSKGNWDLQKTFKCCTGKASTRTPRGTFKLYKKAANGWCYKYVSYFKSRNSFHSRPYGSKTMGKPASNGCIRLYDNDAKYIYKSIPKNTTVVSY